MSTNPQNVVDRGITYAKGLPTGLRVVGHAQALADEIGRRFKVTQQSTYSSHSPVPERALDIFPRDKATGDAIANWLTRPEVMAHYGIDYVIWSFDGHVGYIWNPEVVAAWRKMRDRGSPTANHVDHDHTSLLETAPAGSQPDPQPQEDDDMLIIKNPKGEGFLLAGDKFVLLTGEDAKALKDAGVKEVLLAKATVDALYNG